MDSSPPKGLPLALDHSAQSASANEPAFIARPLGAPVYHGFRALEDVVVDGFSFGTITDFESEPSEWGDAFVIAPDGSRAGVVWEFGNESSFEEISPLTSDRWGVWGVNFPEPMIDRAAARRNLEVILPQLRERWSAWRKTYGDQLTEHL